MPKLRSVRLLMSGLPLLLVIIMLLATVSGPMSIDLSATLAILLERIGLPPIWEYSSQQQVIIESIRLPRMLLGVLVGASLAISGAALQGLFRNPLADPSIIGVSAGAALGAALAIVLGATVLSAFTEVMQHYSVPALAFAGGFVATQLVYRIGTTAQGTSVATMLLAGIAISALSGAGLGLMNYIADDAMLRNLTFWQMGSLSGASWTTVGLTAACLIPQMLLLMRERKALNALLLGEAEAMHLGIEVNRLKARLILWTALGVGVCVAASGMIGFVGLVVPHLIRLAIGPDHRYLLPASCMLGACLLLLADLIARTLVAPAEMPIGIVTALLGAPFFIGLLIRQRQRLG